MPAVPDPSLLGGLALFRGLAAGELARLNALLGRTIFPAGAIVLTAEQPGEVAYVVLEGTLRVRVAQPDGSEVTLALLGPGEVVGELTLIERATRSATVAALERSTLLWLDRATFQLCRREMPVLVDNLLALLATRLRLANAQILALATLDVPGRVARQLLALADAYGQPVPGGGARIPLRLTQSDLAALVGATRVRVNQALVGFKRRGFVADDAGHRLTVLDRDALAAYLS